MDRTKVSDFHMSFIENDTEKMTKYILESNVDILNSTIQVPYPSEHFFGFTALHISVENNNFEVVKLLLEHGVDIDAMSLDGTPLVISIILNYRNIFEYLISKGANVNIVTPDLNENAYHLYFKLFDSATLTDVAEVNYFIRRLFEAGCNINHQNYNNETPLCFAPIFSLKIMFQYGANIDLKDKNGNVPLFVNFCNNAKYVRCHKFYADAYIEIEKYNLTKILISDFNKTLYVVSASKMLTLDPNQTYFTSSNIISLRQNYLKELNEFKNLKIDSTKTVYDLLMMDVDYMKFYCQKEEVNSITGLDNMENKYPLFGSIVKQNKYVSREKGFV